MFIKQVNIKREEVFLHVTHSTGCEDVTFWTHMQNCIHESLVLGLGNVLYTLYALQKQDRKGLCWTEYQYYHLVWTQQDCFD